MVSHLHPLSRLVREFRDSESGMTLPMLGLAFFAVAGLVGSTIDFARYQLVQARLSYALDAAGLAAGSTVSTTNLDAEVQKYITANFPAGYMRATNPVADATASSDNLVIDLTANTTMPTTFMNIFGIPSLAVRARSQVTRETSGLELVLALDNTGSMGSSGKLTALKNAASSLVNILYGSKTTVPNLFIGLVPFSQAVNIGTGHTDWMDVSFYNTLNWGPGTWQGCVDANEVGGRDVTDEPPSSTNLLRAYYVPSTDNRPYPYNSYSYTSVNPWVKTRDWQGNPLTYYTPFTSSRGPNAYCPQQVMPMTSSKTTILSAINAMTAVGNTHINLGLQWGWRMISPRWRNLWGGDMNANALPLDYNTPHMNKAIILLTDGENTMNSTIYTAYGYLSDGRLGTTSSSTAVTKLNTKTSTLCTALKNKGVYVYTIVLGTPGTSVQNLMKSCASSENYYFLAPTSDQLNGVFNAIADSLSSLRVSM